MHLNFKQAQSQGHPHAQVFQVYNIHTKFLITTVIQYDTTQHNIITWNH